MELLALLLGIFFIYINNSCKARLMEEEGQSGLEVPHSALAD